MAPSSENELCNSVATSLQLMTDHQRLDTPEERGLVKKSMKNQKFGK